MRSPDTTGATFVLLLTVPELASSRMSAVQIGVPVSRLYAMSLFEFDGVTTRKPSPATGGTAVNPCIVVFHNCTPVDASNPSRMFPVCDTISRSPEIWHQYPVAL